MQSCSTGKNLDRLRKLATDVDSKQTRFKSIRNGAHLDVDDLVEHITNVPLRGLVNSSVTDDGNSTNVESRDELENLILQHIPWLRFLSTHVVPQILQHQRCILRWIQYIRNVLIFLIFFNCKFSFFYGCQSSLYLWFSCYEKN